MSDGLLGLQRLIVDAIRLPSPIPGDLDLERSAQEPIRSSPSGMLPAERLEVYRELFWLRHLASLEDDYPTLSWAVGGRSAFRELATDYLRARPPRTWNLRELGAELPAHVAGHAAWREDPIIRDAAGLDWAFMEAFDAPDVPPLDVRALTSASEEQWPTARVVFHPSLRALDLTFPLHDLRDAILRGGAPERPAMAGAKVIVWRDAACFLHAAAVEPAAFELLVALRAGSALGEACNALAQTEGVTDAAALGPRVGAWFQEWTARGWVSAVRFAPTY